MPVRATRTLLRPERAAGDPTSALRASRHLLDDLRDGITTPAAARALERARELLGVPGLALMDVSGESVWAGTPASAEQVGPLVENTWRTERRSGRPPLITVPLHVHEELAAVLVVSGRARAGALREIAALLVHGLERGELEASAEHAGRAELRALRAEISPHFVHNALTVISSLVRGSPERAQELLLDFADYARYTFARSDEYTTVSEEFCAIETYLALQRAVLGERLQVRIRVAPEVLGVALPCLILEPLVENAIRHGIEPRTEPGTLEVRGGADGDECVITVEDDGPGMPPEHAAELLAGESPSGRVGLANVDRRLRKVYGSWFGLVLETDVGSGTRAVVRLPRFQAGVTP
ncbi:histidine kinase [Salinifilum aidingensis]